MSEDRNTQNPGMSDHFPEGTACTTWFCEFNYAVQLSAVLTPPLRVRKGPLQSPLSKQDEIALMFTDPTRANSTTRQTLPRKGEMDKVRTSNRRQKNFRPSHPSPSRSCYPPWILKQSGFFGILFDIF